MPTLLNVYIICKTYIHACTNPRNFFSKIWKLIFPWPAKVFAVSRPIISHRELLNMRYMYISTYLLVHLFMQSETGFIRLINEQVFTEGWKKPSVSPHWLKSDNHSSSRVQINRFLCKLKSTTKSKVQQIYFSSKQVKSLSKYILVKSMPIYLCIWNLSIQELTPTLKCEHANWN